MLKPDRKALKKNGAIIKNAENNLTLKEKDVTKADTKSLRSKNFVNKNKNSENRELKREKIMPSLYSKRNTIVSHSNQVDKSKQDNLVDDALYEVNAFFNLENEPNENEKKTIIDQEDQEAEQVIDVNADIISNYQEDIQSPQFNNQKDLENLDDNNSQYNPEPEIIEKEIKFISELKIKIPDSNVLEEIFKFDSSNSHCFQNSQYDPPKLKPKRISRLIIENRNSNINSFFNVEAAFASKRPAEPQRLPPLTYNEILAARTNSGETYRNISSNFKNIYLKEKNNKDSKKYFNFF